MVIALRSAIYKFQILAHKYHPDLNVANKKLYIQYFATIIRVDPGFRDPEPDPDQTRPGFLRE
jgi:hypothetical protein